MARQRPHPLSRAAAEDLRARQNGKLPRPINENLAGWRALGLVFMVQTARSLDGIGATEHSLEQLLAMPDGQLNTIALGFWERHTVGTFHVGPEAVVLMPEFGWYMFPVLNSAAIPKMAWAQAIPLNPRTVLFAAPSSVKVADHPFNATSAALFSVLPGPEPRKVVVPALAVRELGEDELKKRIPEMRLEAQRTRDNVKRINLREAEMFRRSGLAPAELLPGEVR